MLARDKNFLGEISLRTKSLGGAFEGWNTFCGGCFQTRDFDNKSLPHFVRRLAQRWPPNFGREVTFAAFENRTTGQAGRKKTRTNGRTSRTFGREKLDQGRIMTDRLDKVTRRPHLTSQLILGSMGSAV